jgi:hypothetical protein
VIATGAVTVRRSVVVAALSVGLLGCRKKAPPPAPPEPPRPAGVVLEVVVPDPAETWGRARALLGVAALPLPRSAFGLVLDPLGLPPELEASLEPGRPAVLVSGASRAVAAAWGLSDPGRLATFAKDRFALDDADGVRWLGPLGSGAGPRWPVGVRGRFLVVGSTRAALVDHATYLIDALARRSVEVDARLVVVRPAEPAVVGALDRLDALVATPAWPDAPSSLPPTRRSAERLLAQVRAFVTEGRAFRLDVALGGDALGLRVRPAEAEAPSATASVPGELVRSWVGAKVKSALP